MQDFSCSYFLVGFFCASFFLLCAVSLFSLVPTGFCQLSADLLRFLWFPQFFNSFCSSLLKKVHIFPEALVFVSFPKVRTDFAAKINFLWFAFIAHECSTIAAVSQSYFFTHFLLQMSMCGLPQVFMSVSRFHSIFLKSLGYGF